MPSSSILQKISSAVVGSLESFFFWYGFKVGQFPWWFAAGCLLFTGLCGIGLINYTEENNAFRLWIAKDSQFVKNYEFLVKNYPQDVRFNNVILSSQVEGQNVLNGESLALLQGILEGVAQEIVVANDTKRWEQLCKKVPVPKLPTTTYPECRGDPTPILDCTTPPPQTNLTAYGDWLNFCQHDFYCGILDGLIDDSYECLQYSILDLWPNFKSPENFSSLSQDEILEAVNQVPLDSQLLNSVIDTYITPIRDENGYIIGAESLSLSLFGQSNSSLITEDDLSNAEDGVPADAITLEFEEKLRDWLLAYGESELQPKGYNLYVTVARGYVDVAKESITADIWLLPVGFLVVTTYGILMLGHLTCVENRALLCCVGISIIGITILVTYGLCSAFGLFYGPMHNAFPFLILGIGIDDMFVIMQSLDNLKSSDRQENNIPQNIGQTMKHAGVAITVTSMTDIVVFAVGASTKLPALQSFCLYCAVGIFAVFVFQATLFVACVALDLRRIESNRNGLFVCYKHRNHTANNNHDKLNLRRKIFRKIGEIVNSIPGKIVVFATTFALLGYAIYGLTQLETKFESTWFLPQDSYVAQWRVANEKYYANVGERVTVYLTNLDYSTDLNKIGGLIAKLQNMSDVVTSVNSFYPDMNSFTKNFYNVDLDQELELSEAWIRNETWHFLFSYNGFRFQPNFNNGNLTCEVPIEAIELSTFEFIHRRFNTTSEHIDGMNAIYEAIEEFEFSNSVFPMTQEYANWETDAVIKTELFRNIGLSMACVFVTMLLLLADIWGSILTMICVVMSLIDVMGYMQAWGLTIDVVSSVIVIISIGLCVDYSAHIAHAFLTSKGSRSERSILALQNIGPAVLNGGLSTFLALVLLSSSDSYVFSTFFKVFFLVIVFGLFHGLVFFPALLGLIGPSAYALDSITVEKEDKEKSLRQTTKM